MNGTIELISPYRFGYKVEYRIDEEKTNIMNHFNVSLLLSFSGNLHRIPIETNKKRRIEVIANIKNYAEVMLLLHQEQAVALCQAGDKVAAERIA